MPAQCSVALLPLQLPLHSILDVHMLDCLRVPRLCTARDRPPKCSARELHANLPFISQNDRVQALAMMCMNTSRPVCMPAGRLQGHLPKGMTPRSSGNPLETRFADRRPSLGGLLLAKASAPSWSPRPHSRARPLAEALLEAHTCSSGQ